MDLFPISKSKFGVWSLCPWRAGQEYYHKIRPPAGPAAARGLSIHKLRQAYLEKKVSWDQACSSLSEDDQPAFMNAVMLFEFNDQPYKFEQHLRIGHRGKPVGRGGIAHGILDTLVTPDSGDYWVVEDLKTGHWAIDDVFERRLYTLLGLSVAPDDKGIIFQRTYCDKNIIKRWVYDRVDGYEVQEREDGADETTRINLWYWLSQHVAAIKASVPEPNLGNHCYNWYGKECWFLSRHCPAAMKITQETSGNLQIQGGQDMQLALKDVMAASNVNDLDPSTVSRAFHAVQCIKHQTNLVESKVKEWVAKNGPFSLGDTKYGWTSRETVIFNPVGVLKEMMKHNVPLGIVADAISVTKTSINNLRGQYRELKDIIYNNHVLTTRQSRVFGPMKGGRDGRG